MAKKKKHKIKRSNHKNKVVKKSTINTIKNSSPEEKPDARPNDEKKYVISDVKYSLTLVVIIIVCFIALSVILSNKAVSDQIYGIIKINF